MKSMLGFVVAVPRAMHQKVPRYKRMSSLTGVLEGEVQERLSEMTVKSITLLGSGILVFGAILTFVNLILTLLNAFFQKEIFSQMIPFDRRVGAGTATITKTRLQLNQLLALGLEILVISDLVETLVRSTTDYSYDSLGKLALIASIRTLLSFFLGLETKEIIDRAKEDERLDGITITPFYAKSADTKSSSSPSS
mmetsp:Transcript_11732/g.17540  ORF Transcript_11732/g.17540 Transcript_11732/m.17540 type:complete len:195 (-) Transcript_11732:1289-1873(-)